MKMQSLYNDERLKMTFPQACYYCGSRDNLTVDHLIPRIKGGPDESDNLIWACRSCNSSKQGRDMLTWMQGKNTFPSLLLLRRYSKIVARYCEASNLMSIDLSDAETMEIPFDLSLLHF
ncbi:MAG: HNH endonuclease [Planctomycetes bacterium]|nr:HNH endonuclease [Planctomycetota bacterium]